MEKVHQPFDFYACSCEPDGGVYRVEVRNELLQIREKYPCHSPMYMAAEGGKLSVLLKYPYRDSNESGLATYDILPDGRLGAPTEPISTGGQVACHLSVEGSDTYIANYIDGSVLHVGGRLDRHTGIGTDPDRQEGPHCHCAVISPCGSYVLCADLGLDMIFVYDRQLNLLSTLPVSPGQGCRHLVYSPDGKYLYCVCELGCTVTVFAMNGCHGRAIGVYPTTDGIKADYTASAICLSPEGDRLFVSNRGENTVAVFSVDGGHLTHAASYSTLDDQPRDFQLMQHGSYGVAANQNGSSLVLYRIDGTHMTVCDRITLPTALAVLEIPEN